MYEVTRRRIAVAMVCVLGLAPLPAALAGDGGIVDFESGRWAMPNAETVEHLGRTCLMGTAYLPDVEFENGVIEVDLAVTGARTYAGINFRMQSSQDLESFYVRPHRAGLYPDALQYTPVMNGISSWQVYSGEGYTAGTDIPENQWVHVRLEIMGQQARVFLGEDPEPALRIDHLEHGRSSGPIGLYGRRDGAAYFSNFAYSLDESLDFMPQYPRDMPPGMIDVWEISQVFSSTEIDLDVYPDRQELERFQWQPVTVEPSGIVNIARYAGRRGMAPDCIFAKATVESDRARAARYLIGYSDYVTVFLNGESLFSGNSSYQSRDPSFLGILGTNDALYLPLREGGNELMLMVAEGFGGWAFMVQDANAVYQNEALARAWETGEDFRVPEAVVYDEIRDVFYVSNYDAYNPSNNAGMQVISKVSPDGAVNDLDFASGLNNPTGMAVFRDRLYVVERTAVVEIDATTGDIVESHRIPEPGFPNDIAVDASGNMYVSDSRKSVIYRKAGEDFEVWQAGGGLGNPNGLCIAGNHLLVGNNADRCLKSVDLSSGEITTVMRLAPGIIDGVAVDKAGRYLVSHWKGKMFRIDPSGEITRLLDTTAPEIQCADFGYAPQRGLIVVPTFLGNKLIAYQYTP
jgi:sugar lactone lactonase YvrE